MSELIRNKFIKEALWFLLYLLVAAFVLIPFLWMVKMALTPRGELSFIPRSITLDHFKGVFGRREIWLYFFNSLKISVSVIMIAIPIAMVAGPWP